jgi:molybdopterin synthase sulfur carrier subunit
LLNVKICYFAILRDQTGLSNEIVATSAKNVQSLFEELNNRYNFSLDKNSLRVAINDCFVDWQTVLQNNDEVVFIPPVAGG